MTTRALGKVVVLCLATVAVLAEPQLTITRLQPTGVKFSVKDESGLSLVAFHYNINSPIHGIDAGQHAVDITTKTGDAWVHEDHDVTVNIGDTVNYWMYYLQNGVGHNVLDKHWTASDATAAPPAAQPTTTRAPKPTTTQAPKPVVHVTTAAPIVNGQATTLDNYHLFHQQTTETGSGTIGTGTPDSLSGTGTGTNNVATSSGTGSGSCGCTGSSTKPPGAEKTCTTFPCMIFEDNFDTLNLDVWEHEITAGGGGNWEFEYYTNNRSNSYVRDGKLFIKPTLTVDKLAEGPDGLRKGALDIWGSQPGDVCTGNAFWGCRRDGTPDHIINPIQSARLRSSRGFNFKYGKVEISAKMPTGEWLWPAIWLLPLRNAYGQWPASGEIDMVEARGNSDITDDKGNQQGISNAGSTLHFGSDFFHNKWPHAHGEKLASSGNYGDSFHKYVLIWDEDHISISIDDTEVVNVTPPQTMWEYGGNDQDHVENPWAAGSKMAPFDQDFFLILNVAVGGTAFFPDTFHNSVGKPWNDKSEFASRDFWNAKSQWYPTWNPDTNNGEDAAMQVDYIRVWKLKP